MKKAVVTGAAGYTGINVTRELIDRGYEVYAVVRPGSDHNIRLNDIESTLHRIELDQSEYCRLYELIDEECDDFYHLLWSGVRDDISDQMEYLNCCIQAIECSAKIGCKRFIGIGSQAEYGYYDGIITENIPLDPINAYGAAKIGALYLSRRRAQQLGMEWVWGRLFSLYGGYQPDSFLLPHLVRCLKNNLDINVSSCEQYWDYLHVKDAACAIIDIGIKGHSGEVYNIAYGDNRTLKDYVEEAKNCFQYTGHIIYGDKADPFVSFRPDISKIYDHTGWQPKIAFREGVHLLAYEED